MRGRHIGIEVRGGEIGPASIDLANLLGHGIGVAEAARHLDHDGPVRECLGDLAGRRTLRQAHEAWQARTRRVGADGSGIVTRRSAHDAARAEAHRRRDGDG